MIDIEPVATAAVTPEEGLRRLRALLALGGPESDDAVETAYETLRSVAWQFVSGRSGEDDARGWADVVLRIRQILRLRHSQVAERLTALHDMMEQTIRFQGAGVVRRATTRKHVAAILSFLSRAGQAVPRSDVAAATGLRDANLSRILSNLAAEGLVRRTPRAREVLLSLTPEGRALAVTEDDAPVDARTAAAVVVGEAAGAIVADLWPSTGCAMATWDRKGALVSCDHAFRSLLGLPGSAGMLDMSKDAISERMRVVAVADGGTGEFTTGDGRTFDAIAREGALGSLLLLVDVTARGTAPDPRTSEHVAPKLHAHLAEAWAGIPVLSVGHLASVGITPILGGNAPFAAPTAVAIAYFKAFRDGRLGSPKIDGRPGDVADALVRRSSHQHGYVSGSFALNAIVRYGMSDFSIDVVFAGQGYDNLRVAEGGSAKYRTPMTVHHFHAHEGQAEGSVFETLVSRLVDSVLVTFPKAVVIEAQAGDDAVSERIKSNYRTYRAASGGQLVTPRFSFFDSKVKAGRMW